MSAIKSINGSCIGGNSLAGTGLSINEPLFLNLMPFLTTNAVTCLLSVKSKVILMRDGFPVAPMDGSTAGRDVSVMTTFRHSGLATQGVPIIFGTNPLSDNTISRNELLIYGDYLGNLDEFFNITHQIEIERNPVVEFDWNIQVRNWTVGSTLNWWMYYRLEYIVF